jgi:peptidoglycan DL-endopeptidase CwlO
VRDPIIMGVIRGVKRSSWLPVWALALAACSAACASTGAVPKPFPMPGGSAPAPAPAPTDPLSQPPAQPVSPAPANAPVSSASPAPSAPRSARSGFDAYALTATALSLRGIQYRDGGSDPSGFDCSGFTQYVFGQYGVGLPREVRDQYRIGKAVKPEELSAGDIVFFTTTAPGPTHVAIAIGGDEFVHAPSTSGVVRVEHLSSSYWSPRFLGARRVTSP